VERVRLELRRAPPDRRRLRLVDPLRQPGRQRRLLRAHRRGRFGERLLERFGQRLAGRVPVVRILRETPVHHGGE
jgi:hypothetical protein